MENIIRLEDKHYNFFKNVLGLSKGIVNNYFNNLSKSEQIDYIQYVNTLIKKDNDIINKNF